MKKQFLRLSTLLALFFATASGAALYSVSQEVHRAENELAALVSDVRNEKEAIRILHAEWAYLNHPARLEVLAGQYLEMEGADPGAVVVNAGDLPEPFIPALPSRKPAVSGSRKVRNIRAAASSLYPSRLPVPATSSKSVAASENEFQSLLNELEAGK